MDRATGVTTAQVRFERVEVHAAWSVLKEEAEANVILRREETAATRTLAQTAKVLGEDPLLVRLEELEAHKDLAAKVGQVHLVEGDGRASPWVARTERGALLHRRLD